MEWGGELSQGLLLCAVASQVLEGFFFLICFCKVFLQILYLRRLRKNVCDTKFPLQDNLIAGVSSPTVNQESNGSMCDCLCSVN